ncbi:unnamed protein product [Urochloa decumbens]|uniref:RING-type E3 ubiquitin transferase n=1 Tax=Urochloa decumbens TaxID=240449 RepID=A0ABC9EA20_9POAL
MSGGFPTSGSEPPAAPPDSPSRTLLLMLAACMFAVSFAIVVLVTVFLLFCRQRRDRSSALPSNRCGGDPFPDVEATLPAFPYAPAEDGEQGGAACECAVCLGAVKEGEMVRQLPACTHLYHVVCIDRWLAAHRTCPVCRSQLGSSTCLPGAGGSTISTHQPNHQSRV